MEDTLPEALPVMVAVVTLLSQTMFKSDGMLIRIPLVVLIPALPPYSKKISILLAAVELFPMVKVCVIEPMKATSCVL